MSAIRMVGLTKRFGSHVAVDRCTLDVEDGEFLVLLGPSGCGKTTLLRMIAGLVEPSAGALLLDGRDITHTPPRDRDLAMVFQSYALYPHLSVAKNIGFPLRARRRPRAEIQERVRRTAATLELEDLLDRRPGQLSGGQRQRVALGRALIRDPGAYLMDEPLSNLDAKLRTATRRELTAIHRRLGSTFVYVTHDQVEAMTMATRIALLDGGRLEQVGTPDEVYDEPASAFVAGFLGSPAMNLLPASVRDVEGRIRLSARQFDVDLGLGRTVTREVTLGVRPEHLRLLPPGDGAPNLCGATPLVRGVVTMVENLGSDVVAHVDCDGRQVAVRCPRPDRPRVGSALALGVTVDQLHLFDRSSGRRLVRRPLVPQPPGRVSPAVLGS